MTKSLGIIQSRGLGDIAIALPIARHYYQQGYMINWPICERFLPHFEDTVPWVTWVGVPEDHGAFFLDTPRALLQAMNTDEELVLYQALTGQRFHEELYFQHTSFDQYKYLKAGVPFLKKWQLRDCLTINTERAERVQHEIEQQAQGRPYVIEHLTGSDHRASYDPQILQGQDVAVIDVDSIPTQSVFDWIPAIERAWAVIMVDSVMSNIVDQLQLLDDDSRYFLPRSHIGLTPVQGCHWTYLPNLQLSNQHKTINVR